MRGCCVDVILANTYITNLGSRKPWLPLPSLRKEQQVKHCICKRHQEALLDSRFVVSYNRNTAAALQAGPTRDITRHPSLFRRGRVSTWGSTWRPITGLTARNGRPSSLACNEDVVGLRSDIRLAGGLLPSMSEGKPDLNTRPAPPIRTFTPGPPDTENDYLQQQVSKQQKNNFHSTSLNKSITMVAASVNKTALHPRGVE